MKSHKKKEKKKRKKIKERELERDWFYIHDTAIPNPT